MVAHFAERLLPGRALRPQGEPLPEIVEKWVVGGLATIVAHRIDMAGGEAAGGGSRGDPVRPHPYLARRRRGSPGRPRRSGLHRTPLKLIAAPG